MQLLGIAQRLIADEDLDLSVSGRSRDGLEPRFFGCLGIDLLDVGFQPAHQEQEAQDRERPHSKHDEQDDLVAGHVQQCLRA